MELKEAKFLESLKAKSFVNFQLTFSRFGDSYFKFSEYFGLCGPNGSPGQLIDIDLEEAAV